MFRFREDVNEETRRLAREKFKQGIEALPAIIPVLRDVHVDFNINKAEQWDICLVATLSTLEDVATYSGHPAHKAVASELMKNIEERACVDFAPQQK